MDTTNSRRMDTKKIVTLAMLSAIAYVVMLVGRIPVVLFLKYDPKDIVIAIGAFIYGPMAGLAMSIVVSFVEMLTSSDTGLIGFVMNVLSTCVFVCPAAFVYKKDHTIKGAIIGLIIGAVAVVIVMLLWNYLLTPIYMGYPRDAVVDLLLPAILPFNVLKAGLNATLTILLYKPVVKALRKAKLMQPAENKPAGGKKHGVTIIALLVLATCILFVLVLKGVI